MEISDAFTVLRKHFGTHSAAAIHLGITPEHYRAIRNGRQHIKKSTADLIILKAMTAKGEAEAVPATGAVNSVGGQTQTVTV